MILAVFGDPHLVGHPEVFRILREAYYRLRPSEVLSSRSDGVDAIALKVALEMGIGRRALPVEIHRWDGGDLIGYKQRNEQMAALADQGLRILARSRPHPSSKATADMMAALKKPVEEHVVDA